MDFNFTTETITPDSTNILTIGGTGGLELPVGPTSARPGSPQNGIIRYNSDTGTLEGFFSNQWSSSLAPTANQAVVQQNPGAGQFGSIAEACASITEATAINPWEILVAPGTYFEPEIVIPPYVQITGLDEYGVIVRAATPTQNVFVMSSGTSVSFMTVYDAGSGFAGIVMKNIEEGFALCHKVGVYNCDIGFDIDASTVDTVVYLEYCDTNGGVTNGIQIKSSNGFSMSASLENVYVFGSETINPAHGISASGPDTTIDIVTFGISGTVQTGHGIHAENGAQVYVKAGYSTGWDTGIHISDAGLPSNITILAVSLSSNITDLRSNHPLGTGVFNGVAHSEQVDTSLSPLFTLAYSDQTQNRYIQTGAFFLGPTGDTITEVTPLIIDTPAVGLLNGGIMSSPGGTIVDVSAGEGYLRKNGLMTLIRWDNLSITLTPGTQPYLYIDNNGVLSQAPGTPDYITNIVLGRAGVNATQVFSLGTLSVDIENYGNKLEDYLRDTVGPIFVSGSIVTENTTTPRAVDVTAGHWYYGSQQRFPSAKTAPLITIPFHVGGVLNFASSSQIPNTSYDNGLDLVPLTPGFYTKHVLYQSSDGLYQAYLLAYGQEEYATEAEAIGAPLPFPYIDPGPTPRLAAIVVQQGVDSLSEILDVRPIFSGKSGTAFGATVHGDLLGLDADDHKQYLLVSGTRPMTGSLNMGTSNITNVGTVNGVTVQAHGSRHTPNTGADPLPTASAVGLSPSTVNGPGIANTFARSDHTHQLTGIQPIDATLTALAAYNTNGLLTQTAPDTFTGRTITGTASRILVTNGNGVAGNPTIDIVPDPILLGTGAVGIPTGTTAQRPTPAAAGMTRYNTELQRFEVYQEDAWRNYTDALYLPGSTYKTIQDFIDIIGSRGTFSGGMFTDNGDGTIAVTGGTGMSHPIDDTLSPLYFLDYPTTPSVTLTDNTLNNIFVDYNGGNPQIVAVAGPDFSANKIIIGQVYRSGTTLTLNNFTRLKLDNSFVGIINRFQTVDPFQHESGAVLSATGTRNFAISAGVFWEGIDRIPNVAKDTSTGDTFTYWYRSGASSWVSVPGQTQIDNGRYNNPNTGLANLSNKAYGSHWVYLATNGQINVIYGLTNTTNLVATQDSQPPPGPPNTLATATLVGRIIIQDNAAAFTEVTSAYNVVFTGGAVTPHNDLGGLQGGTTDEYYHLTLAQNTTVTSLNVAANGLITKFGPGNIGTSVIVGGAGITVTNGSGVTGNPTISLTNPSTGSVTSVAATQPAAGLTITGSPITTNGTLVFALANDLAAVEGLTTTGMIARTATDTWAARTITGTANTITVTNGTGVAGNPIIDIAPNPIIPGTSAITLVSGTTAQRPAVPTNGMIRYNTDISATETYSAGTWTLSSNNGGAVRVASTTNVTISAPGATIDGIALVAGDRILLKDQTSLPENGIYIWNGAAVPATRAIDQSSDWNGTVPGRIVFVNEGNTSRFFNFRFVSGFNGTFGTTAITVTGGWQQYGRITFGDRSTPERAATGSATPTDFQLIDDTANMRTWKFNTGGANVVTGLEMAIGTNDDVANAANIWWDMSLSSDTQEGVRFARRTGGTVAPKLFLDTAGRLTIGDTVLAGGSTGAALATTAGVVAYFNSTDAIKIPAGTTAQRPATPQAGMFRLNGTNGYAEMYNGLLWFGLTGIIDKSTANVTQTGTTAANIISYTVPAGLLGAAGIIRFKLGGTWINTGGGNRTMTVTISYGGTTMYTSTTGNMNTALNTTWAMELYLSGEGSATSQGLNGMININAPAASPGGQAGSLANSTTSPFVSAPISGTSAVNSNTALAFNVSVVSSITTNTFNRQFYTIELL